MNNTNKKKTTYSARIIKIGKSNFAFNLPKELMNIYGIKHGDYVLISLSEDTIQRLGSSESGNEYLETIHETEENKGDTNIKRSSWSVNKWD